MPWNESRFLAACETGARKVIHRVAKFFLTFPSGLLYLGVPRALKQFLRSWTNPPPALRQLLKELSNFRVGRGIYLGGFWQIPLNLIPFEPRPNCSLAVVDHRPVGGRWDCGLNSF